MPKKLPLLRLAGPQVASKVALLLGPADLVDGVHNLERKKARLKCNEINMTITKCYLTRFLALGEL